MKNEFENGLTVKELKEIINKWPETDERGNDSEVWIETGQNRSSLVTEVWPLNGNDLLFSRDFFKENNE